MSLRRHRAVDATRNSLRSALAALVLGASVVGISTGATGCVGDATRAATEAAELDEKVSSVASPLVGARPLGTLRAPLTREEETDVRVYEPPRLDAPAVSDFVDPRVRWDIETSEATYGACRGEGCCYIRFEKLYDPRKGKPIEIPVLVCQ